MNKVDDIVIRQVKEADLPALEWEGEYIHFRRLFRTAFRESMSGNAVLWIAEVIGRGLVGQAFVQLNSHNQEIANGFSRAYVHGVRVRPEYRKRGIGSHLMIHLEMDLISRGFVESTLNVGRDNLAARRLYERLGYRIVGADPGEWSYIDHLGKRRNVSEPAWRMMKIIGLRR